MTGDYFTIAKDITQQAANAVRKPDAYQLQTRVDELMRQREGFREALEQVTRQRDDLLEAAKVVATRNQNKFVVGETILRNTIEKVESEIAKNG